MSFPTIKDNGSQALVMIEWGHYVIHNGIHYYACYTSGTLASGAVYDIVFATTDTPTSIHWHHEYESPLLLTTELYEGPTISGGTAVSSFNSRRSSSSVAEMSVVHSPTVSDVGTLICQRKRGSSSGKSEALASSTWGDEKILKRNTKYLLRHTSGANSNYVSGELNWYDIPRGGV